MTNKIKVFENKNVRTVWNEEEEDWYFSVVDVCYILSESAGKDIGAYWRKLKQRLKAEGSEVVTKCHALKLESVDGKSYKTDCLSTKNILRLIQSIPSPKAEPFKVWLAQDCKLLKCAKNSQMNGKPVELNKKRIMQF